jgi:hypothetical protein
MSWAMHGRQARASSSNRRPVKQWPAPCFRMPKEFAERLMRKELRCSCILNDYHTVSEIAFFSVARAIADLSIKPKRSRTAAVEVHGIGAFQS